jgi:hypothetical protein
MRASSSSSAAARLNLISVQYGESGLKRWPG